MQQYIRLYDTIQHYTTLYKTMHQYIRLYDTIQHNTTLYIYKYSKGHRFESHRARHIFQACPVWIYTQSNITQACYTRDCLFSVRRGSCVVGRASWVSNSQQNFKTELYHELPKFCTNLFSYRSHIDKNAGRFAELVRG